MKPPRTAIRAFEMAIHTIKVFIFFWTVPQYGIIKIINFIKPIFNDTIDRLSAKPCCSLAQPLLVFACCEENLLCKSI
jgi:hypothetical protein